MLRSSSCGVRAAAIFGLGTLAAAVTPPPASAESQLARPGIGALGPGFCDAAGHAPEPASTPEGYELRAVFSPCSALSAAAEGGSALDTFGYVFTPRVASPWEQPSPASDDETLSDPPRAGAPRRDAFASVAPGVGVGVGGDALSSIRALEARGDAAGPTVRRPASFKVDHSAEVTLDALAASLEAGQSVEIGRWREGDDMALSATFERSADPASNGAPRLKLRSDLRWSDAAGVTRVLVLPYRNADTLRYMRAQLRASAAADRIARLSSLR